MAGQNWRKNKKGFMVNPEGKTARQVKQEKYAAKKAEAKAKASGTSSLSVSGGGGEAPARGRSRLGKLIDSIEANQKADVQNYRSVLKVADKANAMASGKPGGQPTAKQDATRSQLPGTAEKKGRFSKAVSDLEAIDKADLKNAAKTYGATAALMGAAKKSTEKTAKGLSEGKTKLLQKASEGKTPANPASKGSEEIDPSRYLESNTSKTINTSYRVNKFDIDMVSSRKKAGDFDVEGEARKIASAGGVTTNLPLVAMRQDKKIEVVAGDREFFANKRAQELNPNEEMVSGVFLKSSQIKGALAQKSVFKDHEGDFTVQSGQFSRVDTADIESSIKQPSKKVLDAQVKALLDTGDVGNVIPVILQRVGKKSAVNQKYKVISGHDSFLAMRELKRRNPNYEMTNAFILD